MSRSIHLSSLICTAIVVASNILGLAMLFAFGSQSPCNAAGQILLPDRWADRAYISPDGALIAVNSPPNWAKDERGQLVPETHDGPRITYIVNSTDYTIQAKLTQEYWTTWSRDSKLLACESITDHTVDIFAPYANKTLNTLTLRDGTVLVHWSPDSTRLAIIGSKGVFILPVAHDKPIIEMDCKDREFTHLHGAWSPDGLKFAACDSQRESRRGTVCVWSSQSGQLLNEFSVNTWDSTTSWSTDGKLFMYSEPGLIHVLQADSMRETVTIKTKANVPVHFQFSPDGKRLAFADVDIIHIYDVATISENLAIPAAKSGFYWIEWSPDGQYILIESVERLAICDSHTGSYLGHKFFKDCISADWVPNKPALLLKIKNTCPIFAALNLPSRNTDACVFDNGEIGSPGWENQPTPKNLDECYAAFNKYLTHDQLHTFKNTKEAD